MEKDETLEEAAARETLEEAEAEVEISRLYAVFSIPHVSQVYVVFRGTMKTATFGVGMESMEVALFKRDEVPWSKLAFRVIHEILECYCKDGTQAPVHIGTIRPSAQP